MFHIESGPRAFPGFPIRLSLKKEEAIASTSQLICHVSPLLALLIRVDREDTWLSSFCCVGFCQFTYSTNSAVLRTCICEISYNRETSAFRLFQASCFLLLEKPTQISISLFEIFGQSQNGKTNDGRVIQDIRMAIPHNRSLWCCGTMAIRISRRSYTYYARNHWLTSRYLFLPHSDFGFRITDLGSSFVAFPRAN